MKENTKIFTIPINGGGTVTVIMIHMNMEAHTIALEIKIEIPKF